MYSEMKKNTPNIASATSRIDDVRAGVGRVPEEPEREHRRALVPLEQDERDERDARRRGTRRGCASTPAVRVRLDEPVREREEADRGRRETGQVEPLVRLVARLVDEQEAGGDGQDADGDVDEEDPAPVDVLGQQPADERADRERERRDAGPDADRGAALAGRERRRDDRERRGVHERRADTLDHARGDQLLARAREPAPERREREDRDPDDEDRAGGRTRPRPCRRSA